MTTNSTAMTEEKIQTQVLGVAGHGARLEVRVPSDSFAARSINWEVSAAGEQDPIRYGLCLLDAESRSARVNVIGLEPGRSYHYRFICDNHGVASGAFETQAQMRSGSRAA